MRLCITLGVACIATPRGGPNVNVRETVITFMLRADKDSDLAGIEVFDEILSKMDRLSAAKRTQLLQELELKRLGKNGNMYPTDWHTLKVLRGLAVRDKCEKFQAKHRRRR